jgi:hypothetical protein
VFLDIKKAFDRTWKEGILFKLSKNFNISGKIWLAIENFISNRTFTVNYQNIKSSIFNIDNGVPQGCVLSPLLFAIFINDIIQIIQLSSPISVLLFADHIVLYPNVETQNANKLTCDMNIALDSITNWANKWYVQFNAKKSGVLPFTKKSHSLTKIQLSIQNNIIPVVQTYKYLGIVLHYKLDTRPHYNELLRKTRCFSNALCHIISISQCTPTEVRSLTIALIHSRITYSLPFLQLSSDQLSKLQSTLTRPLLRILNLPWNTHRSSILAEFGLLPLKQQQTYQHIKLLFRTLTFNHSLNPATSLYCTLYNTNEIIQNHCAQIQQSVIQNSIFEFHEYERNEIQNKQPKPIELNKQHTKIASNLISIFPHQSFELANTMIQSAIENEIPLLPPVSNILNTSPKQIYFRLKKLMLQLSIIQLKNDCSTNAPLKKIKKKFQNVKLFKN